MIEPIRIEFAVRASVEHAFEVWTQRSALWWPVGHTISKDTGVTITFEARPHGRIYERDSNGLEHDWGEVVEWDPPHGLTYLWFLFFDRSEATQVAVTFTPTATGTTVELTQTGFEHLGDETGTERRDRTVVAWTSLTEMYTAAVQG